MTRQRSRSARRPTRRAVAGATATGARKAARKAAAPAARLRPAPVTRPASGRRRYTLTRLGSLDRVQGWIPLNQKLGLKAMGITVASFPAGEGYEHPHIHSDQEEIYLLAHGRGQMAIDGRVIDLEAGDIVRVDPPAVRALRSHPSSPSVWFMVGATPGLYREKDYTELNDQPAGF